MAAIAQALILEILTKSIRDDVTKYFVVVSDYQLYRRIGPQFVASPARDFLRTHGIDGPCERINDALEKFRGSQNDRGSWKFSPIRTLGDADNVRLVGNRLWRKFEFEGVASIANPRLLEAAWSDPPSLGDSGDGWAQASVVASAGILLSCAAIIRSVDQLQRAGRPRRSRTRAVLVLSGAIISLVVCAAAILIRANPAAVIAALTGSGILLAVFAIRQWLLGPWGVTGLAAAAAIGLLGAFAVIPVKKNVDLTIALSTQTQAATERMLSDVAPVGYGAGTFEALLPVYRDIGGMASREHPTAAAAITVEMGRAFFYGLIIVALFAAWTLFNRSLSRGHDYIYAAAGAGALISLLIMAFVNGGMLNFGASLMIGVLFGLAFAQSLSGAVRDVISFHSNCKTLWTKRMTRRAKADRFPCPPLTRPRLGSP